VFYDVVLSGGPEQLLQWALVNPHVRILDERRDGARIEIDSNEPAIITSVLKRMINDGLPILEFRREERKLEDAFIDMLGKIESGAMPIHAPKSN
jgi:ABC-2 type transport system ATP-binding protein